MNKNLKANTTLSHYRILRKIGAGGMGEVYLAEDTELERQVALKVLLPEVAADDDRLRRFVQEAKAASALNHPNILTVYEIGTFENSRFIATELIKGETLRERLHGESMTLREVLDIAAQIASALNAAHQAGIVHRDIKPENVMLRDDGLVKVLDFGLAKLTEKKNEPLDTEGETRVQVKTSPGVVMGTVSYMSPEQARGQVVDARADIFSLGVVLYEMIAGKPPFEGMNALEVISEILKSEPPLLKSHVAETPPELQRIVSKALRKGRDERYQTVRDLLNDLKDLKEELAFAAKQARAGQTERREAVTASAEAVPTAATAAAPTTSSAKIILGEIKKHKFGVALASLVLLSLLGVGVWFFLFLSSSVKQIESIAVMPFVNESGNQDVEYLSDGMTETLIKSLSSLPNLNVKPRSSVFRYKGKETDLQTVAGELNVQAILTGRVIQRGEQITLSLELVDVSKDSVIWTESYNRKQSDLVALQSEIARDVSTSLKAKLSGAETAKVTKSYTNNSEAYQLYLKGRYHLNKRIYEDLVKAVEDFKAAIAKDEGFALAYSGLADTYSIFQFYKGSRLNDYLEQAKFYAQRAVELDDQSAETHTSLAFINERTWNWSEAEKHYNRAIEINPNYSTAQMRYARFEIRVLNQGANALARMKRALEIEPSSVVASDNLSQIFLALGDADAALEQAKRTTDLDSQNVFGWVDLTYAQLKKGQGAFFASAAKAVEVSNRSSRSLICLGVANAAAERRGDAMAIVKELEKRYQNDEADATEVAAVYAALGDKEQAFVWLDKAFADHSSLLVDLRAEYPFAALHDDPRFRDLLRRMNLPE